MTSPVQQGRDALRAWSANQPENFFAADPYLQAALAAVWGQDRYQEYREELAHLGGAAAALEADVRLNHRNHNLPRLDPWDGLGQPTQPIEHHPSYHRIGTVLYGSGQLRALGEPGHWLYALSLFYLGAHLGEAGHNCPIACTAGVIKALQAVGTPAQQERWLPRLLNTEFGYAYTGAQFLTEVQGGSDVGANGLVARVADDGSYRLFGEKWFCSNAGADLILITARLEGSEPGTRGLGLFLAPRLLDDGQPNHYRIRRLKDKLGTRTMASGEIDFDGTVAEAMGTLDHGFLTAMTQVIHTSRLYNAFACLGYAQRALHLAQGYARHRQAFGQPIIRYPLVQQSLAKMAALVASQRALALHLAALQDEQERGELSPERKAALRVLVNLNKSRNAEHCRAIITEGLSVLGGNGAIESFSPMPRLLRDVVVCENWEGTHNTLYAQTLRDFSARSLHEPTLAHLRELGAGLAPDANRERLTQRLDTLSSNLQDCLNGDAARASLEIKGICRGLADVAAGLCLAREGETWPLFPGAENHPSPALLLSHFLGLGSRAEIDDLSRLEALA
ncbi:MAG: acyl-CoA dehydrogenase [Myxococcales bacterium]|nr:acyl-CoA dehydrogenase [Myxococcales bacterium]|tara:strand:- start:76 stop:1767 length:1692 start_codon:yes stop_codon:yes gene_type:complete